MTVTYQPYLEYKDSSIEWLGQLPSHWKVGRLGSFGNFTAGCGFPNDYQGQSEGHYPFYKVRDTNRPGNEKFLYKAENYISQEVAAKLGAKINLPGGIMFPKVGAALLGNKRRILSQPSITDNNTMVYSPYDGDYDYWYYWLSELDFGQISNPGPVPSVNEGQLKDFPAICPPSGERTTIASFLDYETARIDKLIEKQQRLIELLKEKRQAMISHAVTKGLNPDAPMKDSGVEWLGEVPEHWNKSRLGFECSVKARLGWKGLKADEYVPDGYIFLATPNIKGSEIDFTNVNYITKERFDESPEIKLKIGDILVTKDGSTTGTTNLVRYLPNPATVNSSIAVLRSYTRVSPQYLYCFFISAYTQHVIKQMQGGMGVPHLFQADLRKFHILLPPLEEQNAIYHHIDEKQVRLNALIAKSSQQIILMQERRKALISAAVTGQIDVRGWQPPAQESINE